MRQYETLYLYALTSDKEWQAWRKWFSRNKDDYMVYWRIPARDDDRVIISSANRTGRWSVCIDVNCDLDNMAKTWIESRPDTGNIGRSKNLVDKKRTIRKCYSYDSPCDDDINTEHLIGTIGIKIDPVKESWRVKTNNIRAVLKGLVGDLTLEQWLEILERFDKKCVYCGENFQELDHVIAVDDGGSTTRDNVVPACWKCNHEKNSANRRKLQTEVTFA